jgi:hypothetical protein
MNSKCYICETRKEHKFNQCLSQDCICPCVEQLSKMYTNGRQDDIKSVHPNFLKIENGKIKGLPSVDKEIAKFVRVDKKEWLPKRKDRRFTKKR